MVVAGRVVVGSTEVRTALESASTEVRTAWQSAWEYVRSSRIGGCTVLGEGAMELASEVAVALGYEEGSDEEWECTLEVLDTMASLL